MSAQPVGVPALWRFHCLTGSYRQVAVGLFGLPPAVVAHDWYLLLLATDGGTGAYLFTRTGDGSRVLCHEWSGQGFGDLPAAVVREVWETGATDRAEEVLRSRCALVASGPSLAPISPRGAFGRPFDDLRGRWAHALVLAR
ncbi:hypothetical protein [Saccharothrix xinjiangensis]|uniref:Uncharacterized protein n=1 Tax=Saccharothrix xinjiangensis TaxID=204798 RepID=A0ABV9XVB2_9PSEU